MEKIRMRRSDIFKTLTACIITSDKKERATIIDSLRNLGIKNFVYYPSSKEACAAFTKFYSTAAPDFILTDDVTDIGEPLSNLPILVLREGINLKPEIMNLFKRKFNISHVH